MSVVYEDSKIEQPELDRAKLFALLMQAKNEASSERASDIRPRGFATSVPLSFAQQRLWLLDQMDGPADTIQSSAGASVLKAISDVGALERHLDELIRRHESLRTRFEMTRWRGVQMVEPARPFRLALIDLSLLEDATEREAASRTPDASRGDTAVRSGQGPLFSAAVLRLGPAEHVLLIIVHHIASDGWSMEAFCRVNLAGSMRRLRRDHRAVARTYGAVCGLCAVAARLAAGRGAGAAAVVLDAAACRRTGCAGASDRPAAASLPSYRGARLPVVMPAELSASIGVLARRAGATPYMVLLAGFQLLLSRWSGQADVVVGSPIAGRTEHQTEGLIGFFINTLLMRADVSDDPSFDELLTRVKEAALGAYAHQDIPFEKLVEHLQPQRDLSRQPLFQVMFALQNVPQAEAGVAGAAADCRWSGPKARPSSTCSSSCSSLPAASMGRSNTRPTCSIARRSSGCCRAI